MTEKITNQNKPTPRQGFLNNLIRNTEVLVDSLESDLRYLHSILSNSRLKPDESISQQIIITTNHLHKAINKLKVVTRTAFAEWNTLYEKNPYW